MMDSSGLKSTTFHQTPSKKLNIASRYFLILALSSSVPMVNLDATSDFETKIDLDLSFGYKTHQGNVKIKVNRASRGQDIFMIILCQVTARN